MKEELALASCRKKLILFLRFSNKCYFIRFSFLEGWGGGEQSHNPVIQAKLREANGYSKVFLSRKRISYTQASHPYSQCTYYISSLLHTDCSS